MTESYRWRGYELFENVRHQMEEMLRGIFAPYAPGGGPTARPRWTPHVDVIENETSYTILADLPGVDPSQLEITLQQGVLILRGERPPESLDTGALYLQRERAEGAFERRISLPQAVNPESVQARSRWGVVLITLSKEPSATPRRIPVISEEAETT
jgi:HSP20 family protein